MSRFDIEQLLRELDESLGVETSSEGTVTAKEAAESAESAPEAIRPPDFVL